MAHVCARISCIQLKRVHSCVFRQYCSLDQFNQVNAFHRKSQIQALRQVDTHTCEQTLISRFLSSTTIAEGKFTLFYYFPYIVPMRIFSRAKLFQTALTISFLPVVSLAEACGIIISVDKTFAFYLATLALSVLYALGEFFRRLIGIMYLSDDQTVVKVSHLTFWGRRNDLLIPVSDIVPLQDYGEHKDVVQKFRRFSTKKYLLFSTKFGKILNLEMFEAVFGSVMDK